MGVIHSSGSRFSPINGGRFGPSHLARFCGKLHENEIIYWTRRGRVYLAPPKYVVNVFMTNFYRAGDDGGGEWPLWPPGSAIDLSMVSRKFVGFKKIPQTSCKIPQIYRLCAHVEGREAGGWGLTYEFFTNYTKMPIVAFSSLFCENKKYPVIKC